MRLDLGFELWVRTLSSIVGVQVVVYVRYLEVGCWWIFVFSLAVVCAFCVLCLIDIVYTAVPCIVDCVMTCPLTIRGV